MHLAANHKWKNKNKKWKHKEKVNGTLSSHDSCRKQTGEHSNLRRHTAYQYQHHKQKLADQGLFQWQNCQVFNDRMTRFSTTKWPGLVEIEDFCSHKHHNTLFSNPPPPQLVSLKTELKRVFTAQVITIFWEGVRRGGRGITLTEAW